MMDEAMIQFALYADLVSRGQEYVMPNISWSWLPWEADLIGITRAGYMNEYEIKISSADFKKDFEKPKHRTLKLKNKNPRGSKRIPNYFWYVAPLKAIPICVPDHAGIIEASEDGRYKHILVFNTIRKARLLHKTKVSQTGVNRMLRATMFKYWDLAKTLNTYKIQKEIYEKPDP